MLLFKLIPIIWILLPLCQLRMKIRSFKVTYCVTAVYDLPRTCVLYYILYLSHNNNTIIIFVIMQQ